MTGDIQEPQIEYAFVKAEYCTKVIKAWEYFPLIHYTAVWIEYFKLFPTIP